MGKQIWPCRKKVKCQCRKIILAILVDLLSPRICAKIRPQGLFGSGEEDFFFKVFTIYGHGSHLRKWTATILAIFLSPNLRRRHIKFEQHWPRGFRGEVVWNSQHFSHTNVHVWCPYKCIGRQTWPRHKKVKHQCTTIILATLVDFSSPRICAKIQPQGILGSGEDILKGFYPIWAWRPSWSTDHNHFSNLSFPQPKEAQYEIWAKLAWRLQSRSRLKFSTFFPYKCMVPMQMHREANLTLL